MPVGYPTSDFFVDESGSKSSASQFFVVAAIKLRSPGLFLRAMRDVRDRTGFAGEFKFSEATRGTLPAYFDALDALDALAESDAHISACVVDAQVHNPFKQGADSWLVHAEVTAQLLVGSINMRELAACHLDSISTPRGCSLGDEVRSRVHARLRNTSLVSAICLDSRSSDGLQVADLVAGAVAFERRWAKVVSGNANSPKAQVARRLQASFGASDLSEDQRTECVNIATYQGGGRVRARPAERKLGVPRLRSA